MYQANELVANYLYTFVVQLVIEYPDTTQTVCTGTAINPNWVVTAAHCFRHPQHITDVVLIHQVGTHKCEHDVTGIVVHPVYNGTFTDLALVRVSPPLGLSEYPFLQGREIGPGPCNLLGYGQRFEGDTAEDPHLTYIEQVTPLPEQFCHEVINDSAIMCVLLLHGRGPCKGDSGGPLFCSDMLVGILSRGYAWPDATFRCGKPELTLYLYEELSTHFEWLRSAMLNPMAMQKMPRARPPQKRVVLCDGQDPPASTKFVPLILTLGLLVLYII